MEETWARRDLPVLEVIVSKFDEPERYQLRIPEMIQLCGLPGDEVKAALRRIAGASPPYIASTSSAGLTYPLIITDVTERARRAVGQWPDAGRLVSALANEFEAMAQREPDPEKKRWLRETGKMLSGTARDIATEIVAKVIVHATGMG